MADKYPKDRFDTAPENLQRVGAHRAPPRRGRGWIRLLWALLAVIILVGLGVLGLFLINGNINFTSHVPGPAATVSPTATATPTVQAPSPTPTPTSTPVATVDPDLTVSVLNGTTTRGLASQVSDTLTAAGWSVGTVANASRGDVAQTIVYYSNAEDKAAALGLVRSLTGADASAVLSQAFAGTTADLTVVIGSDYRSATR